MSDRIFKTQGDALEYLHEMGLKISRAKLSKDYRAGILRCQSDKTFLESDVAAYAESLKAPDFRQETDAESPEGRKLRQLKAMVLDFCAAIPDMDEIATILSKWLGKDGNDPEIAQKLAVCQRRVARGIRDNEAAKHCEDPTQEEQSEETLELPSSKSTQASVARELVVEYRRRHHRLTPDQVRLPEIPGGYDKIDDIDPHARFCLTGIFAYGERGDCERLVTSMGGKVAKYPVLYEQCYVVVGTLASLEWSHGHYGNKIEAGLKCRSQGGPVKIITEDDWLKSVVDYEGVAE